MFKRLFICVILLSILIYSCKSSPEVKTTKSSDKDYYAKISSEERKKSGDMLENIMSDLSDDNVDNEKFKEKLLMNIKKYESNNKDKEDVLSKKMIDNIKNVLEKEDFDDDDKENLKLLLDEYKKYLKDGDKTYLSIRKDEKLGFINAFGEILIPPVLEGNETGKYKENFIWVSRNPKYYIMDENFNKMVDADSLPYDNIYFFSEGMAKYTRRGKAGFINEQGNVIIPAAFEDAGSFSHELASIKLDNLWGFIDKQGNVVIKPEYTEVKSFEGNYAVVCRDNKYGLINKQGEFELKLEYDNIYLINNFARVDLNGKEGYYNVTDKEFVYETKYEDIYRYGENKNLILKYNDLFYLGDLKGNILSEGYDDITMSYTDRSMYIASKDYKKGIIDSAGRIVVDLDRYDSLDILSTDKNLIIAKKNNEEKKRIFNFYGKEINAPEFEDIRGFYNGISIFSVNNKYGLIDDNFNIIVSPEYENIYDTKKNIYEVKKNGLAGAVDNKGKFIIELKYKYLNTINDKYIEAKSEDKYGILDFNGKVILPVSYDGINYSDSEAKDLFVCWSKSGSYFYDVKNKTIVNSEFESISDFKEGFIAKKDGKKGVLDKYLNQIIPFVYDEIMEYDKDSYLVKINNLWGVVDNKNKIKIDIKYLSLEKSRYNNTSNGSGFSYTVSESFEDYKKVLIVKENDKYGIMSPNFKIIVEPRFDEVEQFSDDVMRIKENGKWGLIDSNNGRILLEPVYDNIDDLYEGTALAYNEKESLIYSKQWVALDEKGKIIIKFDPEIDKVYNMIDGYCIARKITGSYINEDNEEVALKEFYVIDINNEIITKLSDFSDGRQYWFGTSTFYKAISYSKDCVEWGVIDYQGNILLDYEYDDLILFYYYNNKLNTTAFIKKDGKQGMIDKNYKIIIQPKYDELRGFSDNLTLGKRDGYWYLILDDDGEEIAGPYKDINRWSDGNYIKFQELNNLYGYIDKSGKIVIKPGYNEVTDFLSVIAGGKVGNKWGIFDITDTMIVEPQFDDIRLLSDKIVEYNIENRIGYINIMGLKIWEIWVATN